ncbi:MAG TPA: DEAD/DEAH box helicase, partial [Candidatus Aenigmarchaeota archaeon]|nr:DEAD/DEAH box helicase [Candidatus Aenigmarchaeota archaeon]HEX32854.1 DEAD/DEAH box helicase [Candidatus Aenigmarchaeota archaeon]
AKKYNTLVVLPTGTGKTLIAFLLIDYKLKDGGKALFLAPTKPLCNQHKKSFDSVFIYDSSVLTGEIPPEKRKEIWKKSDVIFATPQTILNDLKRGIIDLTDVKLLVVDEVHRATGRYAYVGVVDVYKKTMKDPHILAMTASPATDVQGMNRLKKLLSIEKVEIRTEEDLSDYIPEKEIRKIYVDLSPEAKEVRAKLKKALLVERDTLLKEGFLKSKTLTRKIILSLQKRLQAKMLVRRGYYTFRGVVLSAAVMKLFHLIQLVDSYGLAVAYTYYANKLKKDDSKSAKHLRKNEYFMSAIKSLVKYHDSRSPKLDMLVSLLKEIGPDKRIIIFAHYRVTVDLIFDAVSKIEGFSPVRFVGKRKGMTQKKQMEAVESFRDGIYNVMIATSVSEEGIDIPSADVAVLYEPVPSAIRMIQRRGRVGRTRFGKVYILVTRSTSEEGYYWIANKKEKKMKSIMKDMQSKKVTLYDFS